MMVHSLIHRTPSGFGSGMWTETWMSAGQWHCARSSFTSRGSNKDCLKSKVLTSASVAIFLTPHCSQGSGFIERFSGIFHRPDLAQSSRCVDFFKSGLSDIASLVRRYLTTSLTLYWHAVQRKSLDIICLCLLECLVFGFIDRRYFDAFEYFLL